MAYLISNLIENRSSPLVVSPSDKITDALRIMFEHDFSQLPVLDEEGGALGMVTYHSIIQAIKNLGATVDRLKVSAAITNIKHFSVEDELFDILDSVRDDGAVLVMDGDEVSGIITSYDLTEYFRTRSEDLMYIEDIEGILKEFIIECYSDREGNLNETHLQKAIDRIDTREKELIGRYKNALADYLKKHELGDPEESALRESFDASFHIESSANFGILTLYQYIELFLNDECWSKFESFFDVPKEGLSRLLFEVRETRNYLVHFRGEIDADQRQHLEYCWAVFNRSKNSYDLSEETDIQVKPVEPEIETTDDHLQEEAKKGSSRYTSFALWLQGQAGSVDRVMLSFEEIEEIIGTQLPPSAFRRREWWANDSVGHVQSIQWLSAGWRVASKNLSERLVTFARIREREKAYIQFWSILLTKLQEKSGLKIKSVSPDGGSWIEIISLPSEGKRKAMIIFSFALDRKFRLEVYIDSGNKSQNKKIFDSLHDGKNEIEKELGYSLSWERMDNRRASRIAVYTDGHIKENAIDLDRLREWATEKIDDFAGVLSKQSFL